MKAAAAWLHADRIDGRPPTGFVGGGRRRQPVPVVPEVSIPTTASINRIQENQRIAFEMLARDIREVGGNPCTRNIVFNMLDTSKGRR